MGITLYTSRVLLKALGIDDFGIYNLIGGIVTIFSALRNLFATSTQRFLNYEMGCGNKERLQQIFSMSINIQAIICVIFFILVEITGIWLINHKLDIPSDRISAAFFVLHFSVLTAMVSIMTTPFDAAIMANEKMGVFSLFAVIETVLKLIIAYIVLCNFDGNIDNLKLYAVLFLAISLLVRFMNSFYCSRNFPECKYKFFWDKKMFRQLGVFAGWNFIGSSFYSLAYEGINILLNIFGGTAFNAARAVTVQVQSSVMNFVRNVFMASNPQIIKLYAQNKKQDCFNLMFSAGKFSVFILLIIVVPLFFYMDPLLGFWLDEVPPYTAVFCRLVLIFLLFRTFHDSIDILYKASGKLKLYMIVDSFFFMSMLIISYLFLKFGFPIQTPFVVMVIIELINNLIIVVLAHKIESLDLFAYFKRLVLPCFKVVFISVLLSYFVTQIIHYNSSFMLIVNLLICVLVVTLTVLILGLNRNERQMIKGYIFKRKE